MMVISVGPKSETFVSGVRLVRGRIGDVAAVVKVPADDPDPVATARPLLEAAFAAGETSPTSRRQETTADA